MTRPLRAARSAALALVTLGALILGAPAAVQASPSPLTYDALGDSYASGYGVGPYTACGRSAAAYAVQADGRSRLALDDLAACAGATTTTLVSGGQLDALDASTDVVTLTIGGNDIGWSSAVAACLGGSDAQCAGATALVRRRVQTQLPGLLDSVYTQVASHAPNAHVFVTGYPRLFSPEYGAYLGASAAEQQSLNDGADLLDSVIAAAARAHGFSFVDVRTRFDGHGVNSPEPYITSPFDPAPLHPNADGWAAYTSAVVAAVRPGQLR